MFSHIFTLKTHSVINKQNFFMPNMTTKMNTTTSDKMYPKSKRLQKRKDYKKA